MVPVLVSFGPISLYSFGAMLALAFLAASSVVVKGLGQRGLDPALAVPLTWWAAIGGLLGSRLLSVFHDWDRFLVNPLGHLLTGAGFVFYGGLAGGVLAIWLWVYRQRLSWWVIADIVAPAVVLGQAIGRVGCQLAGDGDWGVPTTLPWGMAYPDAIFGWPHAEGVLVHPAPVYETLLYSAIFVILIRMFHAREHWADGAVLFAFLALSGMARFLVEFIRIEPRVFLDLTEAQWVGITLMVVGAIGLLSRRRPAGMGPAVAALLLVTTLGCVTGTPHAPEFVAQDLDGKAFRLKAQRGKVVLLNIFTTWCPPCREEMPSMDRLAARLAGEDFLMVAVAEDDGGAPVVRAFRDEMGLTFPILVESTGSVGRNYQISGYPESFIIDREGYQVARIIGPLDWDTPEMAEDLRTLIRTGKWPRGPDGRR
ncbi:MAG: prolipoprotein diacylglyceryl transferase family protein [bacterium]